MFFNYFCFIIYSFTGNSLEEGSNCYNFQFIISYVNVEVKGLLEIVGINNSIVFKIEMMKLFFIFEHILNWKDMRSNANCCGQI